MGTSPINEEIDAVQLETYSKNSLNIPPGPSGCPQHVSTKKWEFCDCLKHPEIVRMKNGLIQNWDLHQRS